MEQENFSQRRARLIELQRRRGGKERDVPKRRPAKAVFGKCPQCGAFKLPHRACKACGSYDGRQVLKVDEEKK